MKLELLRELASVEPELLNLEIHEKHDCFTLKPSGIAVAFDEQGKPTRFSNMPMMEQTLFFALLDRIQARGWQWDRVLDSGKLNALIRVYALPSDKGGWCEVVGSEVEALVQAYLNACKEEK